MKPQNSVLKQAAALLEKQGRKDAPIWKSASALLSRGSSIRVEVNVGHISRVAGKNQKVFVPGKVLGSGAIDKGVTVGAYSFSARAKDKIESAGGEAVSLAEFLKRYPDGSEVILVR